jgi:hypothetical protein
MKIVYRLTINGNFYDYKKLDKLIKDLKIKWHKDTAIADIKKMVGNGWLEPRETKELNKDIDVHY